MWGVCGGAADMSLWDSQLCQLGWGLSLERNVTFAGHIFMLAQGKAVTAFIHAGKHKTLKHH